MKDNNSLILEIMAQAIRVNNCPNKAAIRFDFYPSTNVLSIDIFFNGKSGKGLTKSWSVDTTKNEFLVEVKKDLDSIDTTAADESDFLGD